MCAGYSPFSWLHGPNTSWESSSEYRRNQLQCLEKLCLKEEQNKLRRGNWEATDIAYLIQEISLSQCHSILPKPHRPTVLALRACHFVQACVTIMSRMLSIHSMATIRLVHSSSGLLSPTNFFQKTEAVGWESDSSLHSKQAASTFGSRLLLI